MKPSSNRRFLSIFRTRVRPCLPAAISISRSRNIVPDEGLKFRFTSKTTGFRFPLKSSTKSSNHFSPRRSQALASVCPVLRKSSKNTLGPLRSGAPPARARPSPSVCLVSDEDQHSGTVGVDAVPLVDQADTSVLFSPSPPAAHHNVMGLERRCPSSLTRLTE